MFQTAAVLEILHAAFGLVGLWVLNHLAIFSPGPVSCNGDVPTSIQPSIRHLGHTRPLSTFSGLNVDNHQQDVRLFKAVYLNVSQDTLGFPLLLFAWTITEIIRLVEHLQQQSNATRVRNLLGFSRCLILLTLFLFCRYSMYAINLFSSPPFPLTWLRC